MKIFQGEMKSQGGNDIPRWKWSPRRWGSSDRGQEAVLDGQEARNRSQIDARKLEKRARSPKRGWFGALLRLGTRSRNRLRKVTFFAKTGPNRAILEAQNRVTFWDVFFPKTSKNSTVKRPSNGKQESLKSAENGLIFGTVLEDFTETARNRANPALSRGQTADPG